MSRSKSVLALALVLGARAAWAGYAGLKATAQKVAQNTSKHFVPVVVTATDLTFGAKLDRAQLRVARYPKESVPAGAFSDPDSVVGQTTKIFLAAREPITATKLSSRGGGLSMLVRPGLRATSLEVNQVSGVSGFVLPGDRVDVLCTVDGRGAEQEATTRTILQNAEVLASGQKTTHRRDAGRKARDEGRQSGETRDQQSGHGGRRGPGSPADGGGSGPETDR